MTMDTFIQEHDIKYIFINILHDWHILINFAIHFLCSEFSDLRIRYILLIFFKINQRNIIRISREQEKWILSSHFKQWAKAFPFLAG